MDVINEHFKEASALFSYVLIKCLEINFDYFQEEFDDFNHIRGLMDKGFAYGEKGNARVAFIHFREAIVLILKKDHQLIYCDADMAGATEKGVTIEQECINPLFSEYKRKYDL